MSSVTDKLTNKGLINPPSFIMNIRFYEAWMGSEAYGCSNDKSDIDIYGFCIPPKDYIFPHTVGVIQGFDKDYNKFDQWIQHHINDKENNKKYDIQIYNIIKYFRLVTDNNPNMIDSLFIPQRCVLYISRIGQIVRENRRIFLHKGSWHKFKGYAYSQLSKCKAQKRENSKRQESIDKHGYDIKFAYHIIRLLNEVEQILIEEDLNLERNREQLKSIRRGEWTLEQIEKYFEKKESELESAYTNSKLRYSPDEERIKELLMNCLEEHYGSLKEVLIVNKNSLMLKNLREAQKLLDSCLKLC